MDFKKCKRVECVYRGHPCAQLTFRKIAAAAAADDRNVQEFDAENDGNDVAGQHDRDTGTVEKTMS